MNSRSRQPEPHTGLQGEGGACRHQGRPTLAQLTEQFDVHPNQITSWKAQLEGGAADVFGPGGSNGVTRIRVQLPTSCPHAALFRCVALGLMPSGP